MNFKKIFKYKMINHKKLVIIVIVNQIFQLTYLKMTKNFIKLLKKFNFRMDIGKF